MKLKRTYMFQYYDGEKMKQDTELITKKEAESLWDKYFEEAKKLLKVGEEIEMSIWQDCDNNIDYHFILKEIDYRDCIVEDGRIYKVTKEKIE